MLSPRSWLDPVESMQFIILISALSNIFLNEVSQRLFSLPFIVFVFMFCPWPSSREKAKKSTYNRMVTWDVFWCVKEPQLLAPLISKSSNHVRTFYLSQSGQNHAYPPYRTHYPKSIGSREITIYHCTRVFPVFFLITKINVITQRPMNIAVFKN